MSDFPGLDHGPPHGFQQVGDPETFIPDQDYQGEYDDGPPHGQQVGDPETFAPDLDNQNEYDDGPPPGLEQVDEPFDLDDQGGYDDGQVNMDDQFMEMNPDLGTAWDDHEQTAVESYFEPFTSTRVLHNFSQRTSGTPFQGVILAYRGNNTGKSVIVGYDCRGKKTARVEAAARRAIPSDAFNIQEKSKSRRFTEANIIGWGLIAWRVEPEYQNDPTSVLRPMKDAWYPETYARVMWDTGEATFESRHSLRYIHADNHLKTDILIYNMAISQEGHYQEALTGRMPVFPSWDEPIQNLHWKNTNAYGGAHWRQKRAEKTRRITHIKTEPVMDNPAIPEHDSGIGINDANSRDDQLNNDEIPHSNIVEEVDDGYYSEDNQEDDGRDRHQHDAPATYLSPILEENFVTPGGVYEDSSDLFVTPNQIQSQSRSHRRRNGMLTPESSTPSISRRTMGDNQATSGQQNRPARRQGNPPYTPHNQRSSHPPASSIDRRETQPRIPTQGGQGQASQRMSPAQSSQQAQVFTPLPQGSQGQASQRISPAQSSHRQALQRIWPGQGGQGQASQRPSPARGGQVQISQRPSPAQGGQGQVSQRPSPARGGQGQALQRTSPAQGGQGQALQRTSPAQGSQGQVSQRPSPARGGQGQALQRTSPAQGGQQAQLRTPLPQGGQGQASSRISPAQSSHRQALQRIWPGQGGQGQALQRTSPAQGSHGQAPQRISPVQSSRQAQQRTPLPQGGQGQASPRMSGALGSQQAQARTPLPQGGQGQASQRTSPAQDGQQAQLRTPLPQGGQGQASPRMSGALGSQQAQARTPLPQDSRGQTQRRGRGQGGGRRRSGGPAQDYQEQEQDTPTPRNNTHPPRRGRGQGGRRGRSNGASNTPVQQNGASDVPVRRSTRNAPRRQFS